VVAHSESLEVSFFHLRLEVSEISLFFGEGELSSRVELSARFQLLVSGESLELGEKLTLWHIWECRVFVAWAWLYSQKRDYSRSRLSS
jgi:hypothetical protein